MSGRVDDELPAIAALTGPEAAGILERALPGTSIRRLEPVQVTGSPGRRATVRYDADVASADGGVTTEMLVACVDRRGLPDGVPVVEHGGEEIGVWRARDDPKLPALAVALDPARAQAIFGRLGIDVESVRLEVRAYRPRSRAVVEAVAELRGVGRRLVMTPAGLRPQSAERRLFLKVVRPGDEAGLADVHERLGAVMPVPRVLGRHHDGLLVIDAVPGRTLRSTLRRQAAAPSPREVVALATAPGRVDLPGEAAERSDERVAWASGLLRAALPDQRDRIDRLGELLIGAEQQPLVTIHGDFHEGQILVRDGVLTGIIDLDDAGPGELVEDLGLIAGRLWTLAREREAPHIEDYVAGLVAASEHHVPADELRRRVGVSLFARATAPFRNQTEGWRDRAVGRLAICEGWLARA